MGRSGRGAKDTRQDTYQVDRNAELAARYNELMRRKPPRTIIKVQQLAQAFLEDEVLQYELHLFNIKEERTEYSESMQGLDGYLGYLYDEFYDGNYSEIQEIINDYTKDEEIGKIGEDTAYHKLLEKYFAKARIDSLNAMRDLYFGGTYKYTVNKSNINITIDNFKKSNILSKISPENNWASDRTIARQKNVNELIKVIKDEFSQSNRTYFKDQIIYAVLKRMDDPTSYDNLRKNYMRNWDEI